MKNILYNNTKLYIPERYYNNNLLDRFRETRYEKEESKIVSNYFNQTDNVLEIGSCLGYVTSLLSKKVNSVITIEANPELKESLKLCISNNDLNNVIFFNSYISNTEEYIDFQTYDNIVAGSGDREDKEINNVRGWGHTQKIYTIKPTKLLDIPNINSINAMVLDIEGGELKFFEENKDFINKNIKKICIELHGHLMKDKNFDNKCLKILNDMQFKIIKKYGISYYLKK
uniref:Methyltransferase FkbM domain-containing protein n=1 Tax=viral metagenome TaxID=1070528 RepID=A0A6C0AYU8_9ZZZZ|tara:strand:- start:32620 stop:33306 length:687 start_codon:yes stop_codon:yes gene_type:complete